MFSITQLIERLTTELTSADVVSITPDAALADAKTIRWVIVPTGELPIASNAFDALSGELDFNSGDVAPQTLSLTPNAIKHGFGRDFEIRFYDGDILLTSFAFDIAGDGDISYPDVSRVSGGDKNVITHGTTANVSTDGGTNNDTVIITKYQYGDVTINDIRGSNIIAFDAGVEIVGFEETSVARGRVIIDLKLTLSTGAEITIKTPAAVANTFQLGNGDVIGDYAAFKDTLFASDDDTFATNTAITFTNPIVITGDDTPDTMAVITVTGTGTVAENAAGADTGVTVTATDPNANRTLTITGTGSDKFELVAVDANDLSKGYTLKLKSGQSLDRETAASYTLTITATDADDKTHSVNVKVVVTDINEHAPVFATDTASFNLAEHAAVDAVVGTVAATDADAEATLEYSIVGTGTPFKIDAATGQIQVADASGLDFETAAVKTWTFNVEVTDGTNTDTIAVTINLTNANEAPVITSDHTTPISLAEDYSDTTANIASIVATDEDAGASLSYSFVSGNIGDVFTLTDQGQIRLATGKALDFETAPTYTLVVAVSDGTNTVQTTVVINVTDVNDNSPSIAKSGTAKVALDDAGAETGVTFTLTDVDTNNAFDWVITGTNSEKFEVVHQSGQIWALRLIAGESFTTGEGTTFTLSIKVNDGVSDSDQIIDVVVSIIDFSGTVAENEAGADTDVVFDTQAVQQANVVWTITGAGSDKFVIVQVDPADATKGYKLKLASGETLDRETTSSFTFTITGVLGSDEVFKEEVTITVTDVNDIAPVFTEDSYSVSVAENITAGATIATVAATDADTVGTLQYRITTGNADGLFAIDATTGVITLATGKTLDYEKAQAHTLTVEVSDGTNTDTANVVVTVTDIFDVAPVFALATNSPSGEMLYIATDGSTIAKPLGITFTIDPADADYMSFAVKVNDVVSSDFAVETIGNVLTLVFKGTAHALSALTSDPLLDLSITASVGDDAQTAYNVELAQDIVIHLHDNKYVKWNELSDGSYGFNIYNNADDQIILEDSKLNGDDFAYSNIIYLYASWAIDPTNSKSAPPSELTLGAGYDIYVIGNDIAADVHIVDDVTGLDTTALKNLIRFEDGVTVISNVEDSNTLPGFTGASTNILTLDTDGDAQTTEDQVELKIVGEAFEFQIGLGDVMTFDEMIGHFLPEVI